MPARGGGEEEGRCGGMPRWAMLPLPGRHHLRRCWGVPSVLEQGATAFVRGLLLVEPFLSDRHDKALA